MIEEYKLGSITVSGETYTEDVEVIWTGEVLPWSRKEPHLVSLEDVQGAVEQGPATIVIGTGEAGMVRVAEEAKQFIRDRGIRLFIDKTEEAGKTFNVICEESEEEEGEQERIVGLFHLAD